MQPIIYQITPSEWVSEEVLIATTGIKPGTIARARRKSWLVGREYRHYTAEGDPKPTSECLYNIEAIMCWIKSQKQPDVKKETTG